MEQYVVRNAEQLPSLLRAFRKKAGLTQGQLAAHLGITQQTLSALERNASKVGADRLLQLLAMLGVEMVLKPRHVDAAETGRARGDGGW